MSTAKKKKRRGLGKIKATGRASKLTPENAQIALNMRRGGHLDYEIAEVIGIHPQNFTTWKTTYKEFAEALKEAGEKPTDAVEAALFRSAMGYSHMEEKVFFYKGKVRRVQALKHYAPNPASMSLYLKARKAGMYKDTLHVLPSAATTGDTGVVSFQVFVERAGFPKPFPKQEEMRAFVIDETVTRLLLGARGLGKTDYCTMLGVAYDLYQDWFKGKVEGKPPTMSNLIVTKSAGRNAAMVSVIAKALTANGVPLEKENSSCIRVKGLLGKDHSIDCITVGAKSARGRHPKRILMDDPVTEEDDSESTRKKVKKLYNELMKLTTNLCIIGQPVHKFDLYEELRSIVKKMEVPHGSIPELDHDIEAQRLAGVSDESISASYFLKVISETGMPLEKVRYVDRYFTPVSEGGDGPPPSVAFIDPSFEGGDFTALTILTEHFDGVKVKGKCYKRAWYDCIDEMAEQMEACGVQRICFETNSLGDQPVRMMRDVVPEGVGVVGKKSTDNKHSRILAAGAYAKKIYLSKDSDRIYIDQVTKYERGAKNDDAPDSLASCLEWVGLIRGKGV